MGLFGFFKRKPKTHEEKVKLAYQCYKAELVEIVFPGKLEQADRIIRSLAKIYDLDLDACDALKYYKILDTYSSIWVRKNLTGTADETAIISLLVNFPEIIKEENIAQKAFDYISRNIDDPTYEIQP